jgi:hypothetical protein
MPDLREALIRQGFQPADLHLEVDEAAALCSLLKLGMDTYTDSPLDADCMRRLDRLSVDVIDRLAAKLADAYAAITAGAAV